MLRRFSLRPANCAGFILTIALFIVWFFIYPSINILPRHKDNHSHVPSFKGDNAVTGQQSTGRPQFINATKISYLNVTGQQGTWRPQFINVTKIQYLNDIPLEMGFQPFVDVEFPHVETDVPRIPHNIHQIWIRHHNNTETGIEVPEQFEQYMKTFPKWNPSWKYYFWTHRTSRKLLEERHPELLTFYDKTLVPVQKSDLMRYVVVYEFGGLYADLDTSCLRSLDIVTTKYSCIVLPEPFEDGIIWENIPYRIQMNVFLCRKKHPFLEQVLRTISEIKTVGASPTLIGPLFFTSQYIRYNNISEKDMYRVNISGDTSSPYFYKGDIPETHDDAIYIPNTRYFLDQPHPWHRDSIKRICENPSNATPIIKRMCYVYTRRGFDRKPSNFTFLEHAYTFSFNSAINWTERKYIPVKKIQSNVQTFNESKSLI